MMIVLWLVIINLLIGIPSAIYYLIEFRMAGFKPSLIVFLEALFLPLLFWLTRWLLKGARFI